MALDYENERYVRVYTRDTVTLKLLTWQARALLWELLRKSDRSGVIDVGQDGAAGVAVLVGIPLEVTELALGELVARGVLGAGENCFVFPNFIAAQETPQSNRLRQQKSRELKRAAALHGVTPRDDRSQNVTSGVDTQDLGSVTKRDSVITKRDEWSRNVTDHNAVSRDVTPSLTKPRKGMGEEGMQGENAPPVASPPNAASAGEPEPDQHDAELDAKFWRVLGEDLRVEAERARADLASFHRVAAEIGSVGIELDAEEKPPGKKTPRRKPALALPADWAPNAGHRELAAEQRVDVSAEAVKFRDYGLAKGLTYADHDAAFRNWLKKAGEWSKPRQNGVQLARGSQAPRKFRDYLSELKARTSESENLLEKPETAESLEAVK